jgi:hypothetical protein
MNKKSVKCSQGIDFPHLTIAEMAAIKDLSRATADLVISLSSASRMQTYLRKFNPVM